MPRSQRLGPSSLPAQFPATLQPKPRTNLPLTQPSTLFSPQPTLEPGWERLLAHASSCLWAGYHLKGCLAQGLPSLYRIFQTSKWDLCLDSSQDNEVGYLTYCFQLGSYPRTSLGTILSGSSQQHPIWKDILRIHTRQKMKDFILKVKANTFRSNFSDHQERGHRVEVTKIRWSSLLLSQNSREGRKEDTCFADNSTLSYAQSLFLKSCNRNLPRLNSTPYWPGVE